MKWEHIKLLSFEKNKNSQLKCKKGMSILEVLIAIGIISFVCIPSIQIIHSLQSKYILDIVEDLPATNVQGVKYHEDGSLRTIFKKGGMRETSGASQIGVFTKNTCLDFYKNFDKDNVPLLHLYTYSELGIPSSTLMTGLSFIGNSLLVSADSASTSLPDLYVFKIDTSMYSSTTPFSRLDYFPKPTLTISSSQDTGPGISQIQSRGSHILTSNTGVKNQANIFKVILESTIPIEFTEGNISPWSINQESGVATISKVIDLIIPGSNSSTTPITKTILYANGKVFVGTEKSVFPEISIFNPQTGQLERSIEVGYGVNDMLVANDLLIIAGPRDPEIEVFSVSTLQKIGEYDLPGGSGNAKVLNLYGDYLHIGRTKGGDEFLILKIHRENSNPTSPFTPMFTPVFSNKVRWSVDHILKTEQYSMLFTADEYSEFQLFQSSDDKGTSLNSTLLHKVDLPDRVSSAVCMKNSIWTAFRNTDGTNPYRLGVLVFE